MKVITTEQKILKYATWIKKHGLEARKKQFSSSDELLGNLLEKLYRALAMILVLGSMEAGCSLAGTVLHNRRT